MMRRSLVPAMALAAALMLSGCIGKLLGGGAPAQTYRLAVATLPPVPPAAIGVSGPAKRIVLSPVRFAPEIEGDRILATSGRQTMYIANARWLAPLPTLFEEVVRDRFQARPGSVVLGDQRDQAAANRVLRITVDRFEAVYEGAIDPAAPESPAPAIVVAGRAALFDPATGSEVASLPFASTQPAASNAIEAIVAAFGRATDAAVASLAAWPAIGRAGRDDGVAASPDRTRGDR